MRTLSPRRPARLFLLAVLAPVMIGCASPPRETSGSLAHDAAQLQPRLALHRDARLTLFYGHSTAQPALLADWSSAPTDPAVPAYLSARLQPAEPGTTADSETAAGATPVRLLDYAQWASTLEDLLRSIAPADADAATLVAIHGRDLVLHLDSTGALRVEPHASKAATLRVTRVVGEQAFAELALERLRVAFGPTAKLLFEISPNADDALVLFDLAARRSVLVLRAGNQPIPATSATLGFAVELWDALVLRSHVLTPLLRPFTSISRLVWLSAQSAGTMLPRPAVAPDQAPPPPQPAQPMDLQAWEAQLDALVGRTRYAGAIEPLIDGGSFFPAFVQAIQDARHSIDIRLYIFDRDDYALQIAELLRRRSREVRVRIVLDYLGTVVAAQVPSTPVYPYANGAPGSASILGFLHTDSNIELRTAANPWLTADHAKVIVIDRRIAFVGGMNIGHEYRYTWHDMMVSVQGPIVGRLARDFEQRWAHAGPGGDLAYAAAASSPETYEGEPERSDYAMLRPLYTSTGDSQILRAQLAAMEQARARIWVQQPYLSDDAMIAALIQARHRGLDVRVILPASGDSGFMNGANLVTANALIRNGVRVYAYPGMTHVKAALYDGWACVGSANFDKLSLRINQETNIGTSDARFAARLERELFERDFERSTEILEPRSIGWSAYLSSFIANQL